MPTSCNAIRFAVFAGVFCIALAAAPVSNAALAQSGPEDAQQSLQSHIDGILRVLGDSSLAASQRDATVSQQIDAVFDFKELTARSLGVHWRRFNPQQQDAAAKAMAQLLEATYKEALLRYDEERIEYLGAAALREDQAEVRTRVVGKGQSIPINYRMKHNAEWRVYDIVIEGVSLVQNYRTQFQELMLRNSPDELITLLRKKASQRRSAS